MTLVVAIHDVHQTVMRADWQVTEYDEGGVAKGVYPYPKIAILSPQFAVGVAGEDPAGAMVNLQAHWAEADGAAGLRDQIKLDGDDRRSFLVLEADGSIWTFKERAWTQSSVGLGWIGDATARREINPAPFDYSLPELPLSGQEAQAEWAREQGFSEADIAAARSGETEAQLGNEISFADAVDSGVTSVSGPALEARLVDGKFTFNKQTETRVVFGGPAVDTTDQATRALLGNGMVSHSISSRSLCHYPAQIVVDFLDSEKSAVFWLEAEQGYQVWFGSSESVRLEASEES